MRHAALSLSLVLLINCFLAPRYWLWEHLHFYPASYHPELNRALSVEKQVADPWAPVEHPSNRIIRFRLLFPLLAHVLHLPFPLFCALPILGTWMALWLAFGLLRGQGLSWVRAAAWTLLYGTGNWFFVSSGWLCYFDAWVALALLAAVYLPSRIILATVCLFAPLIDERFLLGLPLALLFRVIYDGRLRQEFVLDVGLAVLSVLPYLLLRLWAWRFLPEDPSTGYLVQHWHEAFQRDFRVLLAGAWHGLRIGWLPVLAALGAVLQRQLRAGTWENFSAVGVRQVDWRGALFSWPCGLGAILAATVFTLSAAVSLWIAGDISRSFVIFSPLVVWLPLRMPDGEKKLPGTVLLLLAVAALSLPARHVVASFQIPIQPLLVEATVLRPPVLQDEFWVALAKREIRRKQVDQSFRYAAYALQLQPANYEAWRVQGFCHVYRKDLPQALVAFEKAQSFAPADWLRRPEVSENIARLRSVVKP